MWITRRIWIVPLWTAGGFFVKGYVTREYVDVLLSVFMWLVTDVMEIVNIYA